MEVLARWRLLAFPVLLGALLSLAAERVHASTDLSHVHDVELVSSELTDRSGVPYAGYVALPARDLVVKERNGIKRLLLGVALLIGVITYFSRVTYPKIMPMQHKVLQWVAENGLPALDMEGMSKEEYIMRRYMRYAEEKPELVAMELGTFMIALTLIFSGTVALVFPRRRRMKVLVLP